MAEFQRLMGKKYTRRQFVKGLAGAGVAALSGWSYTRYAEPGLLKLSVTAIPLSAKQFRTPLRILHLSDFHLSPYVSLGFIERAILLGLSANPDLICLTGDFITKHLVEQDRYTRLLAKLSRAAPTFACFGNHDGGSWIHARGGYSDLSEIRGMLEDAQVRCLHNEIASPTIKGQALDLIGLGDLWAAEAKPDQAFSRDGQDQDGLRIVLSHNPDSKSLLAEKPWDLMLCGHTHGGQLRIPFLGTPFAPVQDQAFVAGLHPWQGKFIYTTRGVGNLHGLRLNCPPEASILDLSTSANQV